MGLSNFYNIDLNPRAFGLIEFGLCSVFVVAVEENVGRQGAGAGVGVWERGGFSTNCKNQEDICLSMASSNSDLQFLSYKNILFVFRF